MMYQFPDFSNPFISDEIFSTVNCFYGSKDDLKSNTQNDLIRNPKPRRDRGMECVL